MDGIKIVDPVSGVLIKTLKWGRSVSMFAQTDDGMFIGFVDDECVLRVWDPATGKSIKSLHGHTEKITCIARLENGLIVSGSDSEVIIWDLKTGKSSEIIVSGTDRIIPLKTGLFACEKIIRNTKIFDSKNKRCIGTMRKRYEIVQLYSGNYIMYTSSSTSVQIWDEYLTNRLSTLDIEIFPREIIQLKNGYLLVYNTPREVHICCPITGQTVKDIDYGVDTSVSQFIRVGNGSVITTDNRSKFINVHI